MNIVKELNQFNKECVYFCDPIKNNIMTDGLFIRILYSTEFFVMNGIYLSIFFQNITVEKYYNKYRCNFDYNIHKDILDKVRLIEEAILQKVNIKNKTPLYKIYEQVCNGNIKVFSENIENIHNLFLLKISGIWETETNYGVTYKFTNINRLLKNISN
jgi:hypothetical protein